MVRTVYPLFYSYAQDVYAIGMPAQYQVGKQVPTKRLRPHFLLVLLGTGLAVNFTNPPGHAHGSLSANQQLPLNLVIHKTCVRLRDEHEGDKP